MASIDEGTRSLLRSLVDDRSNDVVIRNLAANALVKHSLDGDGDAAAFMKMHVDEAESQLWRDYALQHATEAAMRSNGHASMQRDLIRIVTTGDQFAPTGLLLLQRLEDDGCAIPAEVWKEQVEAVRTGVIADPYHVMAVLGLAGERGDHSASDLISMLRHHADPGIRRACLGAAAICGSGIAEEMYRSGLDDPDPAVRRVAEVLAGSAPTRAGAPLISNEGEG